MSPSLTAGDESLTGGLVAAVTLVGVCDGQLDKRVMRRYRITREDVDMALHQQGLEDLAGVRRAFVEADGEITVIKK